MTKTLTFGIKSMQRHIVVQNITSADRRTKCRVVFSVGSTWERGTPKAQTITTLYMQNPIYLESFKAEIKLRKYSVNFVLNWYLFKALRR